MGAPPPGCALTYGFVRVSSCAVRAHPLPTANRWWYPIFAGGLVLPVAAAPHGAVAVAVSVLWWLVAVWAFINERERRMAVILSGVGALKAERRLVAELAVADPFRMRSYCGVGWGAVTASYSLAQTATPQSSSSAHHVRGNFSRRFVTQSRVYRSGDPVRRTALLA